MSDFVYPSVAEWKQKLNNSLKGSETLPTQQVSRIISETNGKINFSVRNRGCKWMEDYSALLRERRGQPACLDVDYQRVESVCDVYCFFYKFFEFKEGLKGARTFGYIPGVGKALLGNFKNVSIKLLHKCNRYMLENMTKIKKPHS